MKQLSIIVPAYNAAKTLKKCLDFMAGRDDRLEVIVVNDGSTDDTPQIAAEYVQRYPGDVKLLNKVNGGHGSAINAASMQAGGRYLKVVDADDWIRTENLTGLLDALENTQADAVIAGYRTVDKQTGKEQIFPCACRYSGQTVTVEQLLQVFDEISSCCSFHGLFYRTELYRNHDIRLTEGIFYEDHEYETLPFAYVKSVCLLPFEIYMYQLGDPEQSVAPLKQARNIGHIETVVKSIAAYKNAHAVPGSAGEEYIQCRLVVVAVSYFAVALVKNPDKRRGREQAARFRRWIADNEPELLRRTEKKYWTLQVFSRLHISSDMYQRALNTKLYLSLRKIWQN